MRAALLLSFLANIALALVSLAILPERVAIHFGQGGAPNGWASSRASTLFMIGINVLIFCGLYFSPKLISALPGKWISLPNRDYWLAPERLAQTTQRFGHYLWQFGVAVFIFMFVAGALTIQANLSEPIRLNERVFLVALVSLLVFTVYWTALLLRAFRTPH
jgi:uncharacterized membrane protein